MSWYAIDNIDDALSATTELLTPIAWRTWVKLAIVVFFVGSPGGGFNLGQSNVPVGGRPDGGMGSGSIPPLGEIMAVIEPWVIAIAGLVFLVILFFQFVGAVMEFVLVAALRDEGVAIRRAWGEYWRPGARLFGFRLGLSIVGLLLIGAALATVILPMVGFGTPLAPVLGFVVVLPIAILVLLVLALVMGFTTLFVVPVMMVEDRAVLNAWKRFWPTVRREWKQYAVYAVLNLVLTIAGGILTMIGGLFVVLGLLIPFGILGVLAYGLWTAVPLAGLAMGAVVGGAFVITLILAFTLVRVPVVTYLRYYALLVLGDTNDAFDIIPDLRRRIREPPTVDE